MQYWEVVIKLQGLVVFYGACCLALTAVAANLGGILNAALSINGMVSGPMVALFTMAWAFPWCNSWVSIFLTFWIFTVSEVTITTENNSVKENFKCFLENNAYRDSVIVL